MFLILFIQIFSATNSFAGAIFCYHNTTNEFCGMKPPCPSNCFAGAPPFARISRPAKKPTYYRVSCSGQTFTNLGFFEKDLNPKLITPGTTKIIRGRDGSKMIEIQVNKTSENIVEYHAKIGLYCDLKFRYNLNIPLEMSGHDLKSLDTFFYCDNQPHISPRYYSICFLMSS